MGIVNFTPKFDLDGLASMGLNLALKTAVKCVVKCYIRLKQKNSLRQN